MQCLLLLTVMHHSYTTHVISGGGRVPSRSYAVSAPADRDASPLYYSCCIIRGGERGREGKGRLGSFAGGEGGRCSDLV